jgi:hypothetical protein
MMHGLKQERFQIIIFSFPKVLYLNYTDSASTVWASRNGVQPLYKPVCGYQNNQCPQNMTVSYILAIIIKIKINHMQIYFAIGGGALLIVLSLAALAVGYAIR